MKRILFLLLTASVCFTFVQCDNDSGDDNTCKLLKWSPLHVYQNDTIYSYEHVYENNRLAAKIIKSNSFNPAALYTTTNYAINYDNAVKVTSVDSQYERDEFQYQGGSQRPAIRIHYRKQNGNPLLDYTEQITYDTSGRITKAVQSSYNENSQVNATTTFTYEYNDNNLYRYVEFYDVVTPNYSYSYGNVTYIDGYDDKKNPLKNFKSPFVDERMYQFSKNNWTDVHYASINGEGVEEATGSHSSRTLNYTEKGYPAGNIYDCN